MKNPKQYFVVGAIAPGTIAESIAQHERKTDCGAHSIFLGQVRADVINGQTVQGIEYTVYHDMANAMISTIREEALARFALRCLHVQHSEGYVAAGGVSLSVFCSSAHRAAAMEACQYVVDEIKQRLPVWGREVLGDGSSVWKRANVTSDEASVDTST